VTLEDSFFDFHCIAACQRVSHSTVNLNCHWGVVRLCYWHSAPSNAYGPSPIRVNFGSICRTKHDFGQRSLFWAHTCQRSSQDLMSLQQLPAQIIPSMRIQLVTPFAEKDAAKALGARWDAAQKVWYITDVADLTPFLRWIPDVEAVTERSVGKAGQSPGSPVAAPIRRSEGVITTSTVEVACCDCKVLPWEDCGHTAAA